MFKIPNNRSWPDHRQLCSSAINTIKFHSHEIGFVGANVIYIEHVLAYHKPPSLKICSKREALTTTTIYMKCGVKTSYGGQEELLHEAGIWSSPAHKMAKFTVKELMIQRK